MKKNKNKTKYSLGFTLIELLMVISIIGVLSAIIFTSTKESRARTRDAQRVRQVKEVQKAVELYRNSHDSYPIIGSEPADSTNASEHWCALLDALKLEQVLNAEIDRSSGNCTTNVQDPLYKDPSDFKYSYAYMTDINGQNYKIRAYIENSNSLLFNSSESGVFFNTDSTGQESCDKDFNYYCVGNGGFNSSQAGVGPEDGGTMVDASSYVAVTTANERSVLDPRTRQITSTADVTITNTSSETLSTSLHAVISINGANGEVLMPDALGGPDVAPYNQYYYDLSSQLSGGQLLPGQSTTFNVKFVRASTVRFTYSIATFSIVE